MDERSLIEYVTRQRWYGAKSRTVSHSEVLDTVTIRQAEPQLSLALVEMRFDTGAHDIYQLLVSGGDEGDSLRRARRGRGDRAGDRERDAGRRDAPGLGGSGRVQPGRGLLRARPRARRRAARLLRAVEQLSRLRRRAHPQGLPPARARDQPGARDAPLPHRAGLPQHPGARRLVRLLRRAAHRDARAPAGVRRRRDRRLGARARRDRVRARELPRPPGTARRGDRAHAHRPRRRSERSRRSRRRSRASSRSGC